MGVHLTPTPVDLNIKKSMATFLVQNRIPLSNLTLQLLPHWRRQ